MGRFQPFNWRDFDLGELPDLANLGRNRPPSRAPAFTRTRK